MQIHKTATFGHVPVSLNLDRRIGWNVRDTISVYWTYSGNILCIQERSRIDDPHIYKATEPVKLSKYFRSSRRVNKETITPLQMHSVQDAKFSEDQCQTRDVAVMELIVKMLDELSHRVNQNNRTNHRYSSAKRNITCYHCGRKGHYRWNCRQQSRLPTPQNWRNQKQEMKNPEGQLPRYVEDRQAFDSDLGTGKDNFMMDGRLVKSRR